MLQKALPLHVLYQEGILRTKPWHLLTSTAHDEKSCLIHSSGTTLLCYILKKSQIWKNRDLPAIVAEQRVTGLMRKTAWGWYTICKICSTDTAGGPNYFYSLRLLHPPIPIHHLDLQQGANLWQAFRYSTTKRCLHLYFEVNVHPNCYSTLCHWYRMQMAASLPVMQPQREVVWNPGIQPKQRWLEVFWRGNKPKALWSSQGYLENLLGSKQDVFHAHQTNYYTDSLSQLRREGLRSSKSRHGDFSNREKFALFLRRSRNAATSEKETSSSNKSHACRERTKKTYSLKNRIEEQLKLLGTSILWKIQRWT